MIPYHKIGAIFTEDFSNVDFLKKRYTVTGTPVNIKSRLGIGTFLDGSSYMTCGGTRIISQLSQITVSVWVNPSAKSNYDRVVEHGTNTSRDWYMIYDNSADQKIMMSVRNVSLTTKDCISAAALPKNIWSNVTGTYDGSYIRLYINGSLSNTSALLGGDISNVSGTFSIGYESGAAGYEFIGGLKNLAIFPRALTTDEVGDLANLRFF